MAFLVPPALPFAADGHRIPSSLAQSQSEDEGEEDDEDGSEPNAPTLRADTLPTPPPPPKETCKEILDRVKQSDCIKPVARFLDGASVVLGLSFNSGDMEIRSNDTLESSMIGILSPAPYFGLTSPLSFFGRSRWGYEFTFAYNSSVAIYQDVRGGETQIRDLGTYTTITFLSLSPSVFVSVGARDEDPDVFWRTGIGLGAGWASVRGTSYFTLDSEGGDNRACHDAGAGLIRGDLTKTQLRSTCELKTFKEKGLGLSSAFFMDARWGFIYTKLSSGGMVIRSGRYSYHPIEIGIKLAYIHDL